MNGELDNLTFNINTRQLQRFGWLVQIEAGKKLSKRCQIPLTNLVRDRGLRDPRMEVGSRAM